MRIALLLYHSSWQSLLHVNFSFIWCWTVVSSKQELISKQRTPCLYSGVYCLSCLSKILVVYDILPTHNLLHWLLVGTITYIERTHAERITSTEVVVNCRNNYHKLTKSLSVPIPTTYIANNNNKSRLMLIINNHYFTNILPSFYHYFLHCLCVWVGMGWGYRCRLLFKQFLRWGTRKIVTIFTIYVPRHWLQGQTIISPLSQIESHRT